MPARSYFLNTIIPVPVRSVPNCHAYFTIARGATAVEPEALNAISSPTPGDAGENTKLAVGTPEDPTDTFLDREPFRPARSVTVRVTV